MPIPTYTPGYPPDGSSLGQTKVVIRNNLDGTFQTLGVDHVNNNGVPGANPAGYHTVIHQVTQSGDPVTIAGVNQVYSKVVSGDTALFNKTGNGVVTQLTTPNAGAGFGGNIINYQPGFTGGWTFLPGGLIMQYGLATTPPGDTIVPFPISFTSGVYSVVPVGQTNASPTGSVYVKGTPLITSFTVFNGSSSNIPKTYWTAIGK